MSVLYTEAARAEGAAAQQKVLRELHALEQAVETQRSGCGERVVQLWAHDQGVRRPWKPKLDRDKHPGGVTWAVAGPALDVQVLPPRQAGLVAGLGYIASGHVISQ